MAAALLLEGRYEPRYRFLVYHSMKWVLVLFSAQPS